MPRVRPFIFRASAVAFHASLWLAAIGLAAVLATALAGITPTAEIAGLQGALTLLLSAGAAVGLLAATARKWHLVRFAAVTVALWLALSGSGVLSAIPYKSDSPGQFKVAAANVLYRNADLDGIAAALVATDATFAVTSESTPKVVRALAEKFAELGCDLVPVSVGTGPMGKDTVVWAPKDDVSEGTTHLVRVGEQAMPAVTVTVGARKVTVVGVHLTSPMKSEALHSWTSELGDLERWLGTQAGPVVVAGDFNATVNHPAFANVLGVSTDAAQARGLAFVETWPTGPNQVVPLKRPFLGIDHLISRDLYVTGYGQFPVPGSDHLGVTALWAFEPD